MLVAHLASCDLSWRCLSVSVSFAFAEVASYDRSWRCLWVLASSASVEVAFSVCSCNSKSVFASFPSVEHSCNCVIANIAVASAAFSFSSFFSARRSRRLSWHCSFWRFSPWLTHSLPKSLQLSGFSLKPFICCGEFHLWWISFVLCAWLCMLFM